MNNIGASKKKRLRHVKRALSKLMDANTELRDADMEKDARVVGKLSYKLIGKRDKLEDELNLDG